MFYKSGKSRKKKCYSVKNCKKKKTFSKCTTKKSQKQKRLLPALQYNKTVKPNQRQKTNKGGSKETKSKNKTIKVQINKKAIAENEKLEIEKTRPLDFNEYEEWYETVAEQEMNSQLPYMNYIDDYEQN